MPSFTLFIGWMGIKVKKDFRSNGGGVGQRLFKEETTAPLTFYRSVS